MQEVMKHKEVNFNTLTFQYYELDWSVVDIDQTGVSQSHSNLYQQVCIVVV